MKTLRKRAYAKAVGVKYKCHKTLEYKNWRGTTVYHQATSFKRISDKHSRHYTDLANYGCSGRTEGLFMLHVLMATTFPLKSEAKYKEWDFDGRKVKLNPLSSAWIPYEETE